MTLINFTAVDVYKLSDEEIENIILAYHKAVKEPAYGSGKAALSSTLGDNLDLFELEMVEDAARAKSDDSSFHQAITWAWLGYRFHRRIAGIERARLTAPWAQR